MPKQMRQQTLNVFWCKDSSHGVSDASKCIPLDGPRFVPRLGSRPADLPGANDQHSDPMRIDHGDFAGAVALGA
jgi:hypothetical protein